MLLDPRQGRRQIVNAHQFDPIDVPARADDFVARQTPHDHDQ
jgi:hypothetical protein